LIRIILLMTLAASALFAELDWASSYDAAREKAKQEKKLVMVMLTRENCDACWYMENVVFENDDVVYEVEEDFVPVQVDIHNNFVPDGMGYIGTPTFHFVKADGKKIDRLDGAANVKEFTEFIRKVKQAAK
jgi:thioredoxin-related protein